jgi:site-specific recombinase XerD
MSGRHEKELKFENRINEKIKNAPPIITEYYYSLVGAGKSYATTYNYINYLMSFLNFTFGNSCPKEFYLKVKSVHINKYISSLRTKEVNGKVERTSDSMRTVQWSALNTFFQFLVPEYIKENPVANTKRPKMKDNPNVTYLDTNEIASMIKNVNEKANAKMKNRDLCLLKLGFGTGLRASAILQIDIDDIDFKNNQIRVTEKGDYDNYIMFGENLKSQLFAWLKDREEYFGSFNTNALFVSQVGKRMSPDMLAKLVSKYAKGATDKHVTPHVMRHSCATNLYEQTGDIYLCAKQLNHKNVSTTQRYAELSKEKQRAATNVLDNLII